MCGVFFKSTSVDQEPNCFREASSMFTTKMDEICSILFIYLINRNPDTTQNSLTPCQRSARAPTFHQRLDVRNPKSLENAI